MYRYSLHTEIDRIILIERKKKLIKALVTGFQCALWDSLMTLLTLEFDEFAIG